MEYLLFAIILYFILRTTGNLVRLLRGDEAPRSQEGRMHDESPRRNGWEGPSPRQHTGSARNEPTFWGKDIEDATWRDLDGETRPRSNAPH